MSHDIVDNQSVKLGDVIDKVLDGAERAHFAVGYFFLSGFEAIKDRLKDLEEVRLLIGNTSNRETVEQLAEGYRSLEHARLIEARQRHHSDTRLNANARLKQILQDCAGNVRDVLSEMEQDDVKEELLLTIARLIEEKRLKVRVYTKGRLHAKAYIVDYKSNGRFEKGIGIIGSSNLSLAGLSHNTELNVVVHGNENHAELLRWFDALWDEAKEFDDSLMHEVSESWALKEATPYDVYMKTLYTLVKDKLTEDEGSELLVRDEITERLTDFQSDAVKQLLRMIRRYHGAFAADVVGVGKSFIGAAVLKHFAVTEGAKPLIICPASLVPMWERYNAKYSLSAQVVSMGLLVESDNDGNLLLDDDRYSDRTFVLVDESHNFRHSNTQRYKILQSFLGAGERKVLLLTATPRNKTAWDLYHQIKLFHHDDRTDLPVYPPDLRDYFKQIEKKSEAEAGLDGMGKAEAQKLRQEAKEMFRQLHQHILVRRTRKQILKWYGLDAETHERLDPSRFSEYVSGERQAYILVAGRHQFFPQRRLETIEYSIEATYHGLYDALCGYLAGQDGGHEGLTYARYGLWNYLKPAKRSALQYVDLKRAGPNLRGLMRVMLFKRLESSVHAFRETMRRFLRVHKLFLEALDRGYVAAGDDANDILSSPDKYSETDLLNALERATEKYDVRDFELEALKTNVVSDIHILEKMLSLVSKERIPPENDAKLQTLIERLHRPPLNEGKLLIFTEYIDTAEYLFENLNPGARDPEIEMIHAGDNSKLRVLGRFAPSANPEYTPRKGEAEIMTLISTDVLSEGLNLQDCDKIINYDLHWNPVRLIQRFGRIDRIGSDKDTIWGFNFLPETALDKNLDLKETLRRRIQDIHDTIGEDARILEKTEELNEEAMYAIYEKDQKRLARFEEEDGGIFDVIEAEQMFRKMRDSDPNEFKRIAELRDGIRSARASDLKGFYVFCKAGEYHQLYVADRQGNVLMRDVPGILSQIRCESSEPRVPLPKAHNCVISEVRRLFEEDAKRRQAERRVPTQLTKAQKYVLRELRLAFENTTDSNLKAQINFLDPAFRLCKRQAVFSELKRIRRNGITGMALIRLLQRIYYRHNLGEFLKKRQRVALDMPIVRIICSESLV